jgi:hypothetical protein
MALPEDPSGTIAGRRPNFWSSIQGRCFGLTPYRSRDSIFSREKMKKVSAPVEGMRFLRLSIATGLAWIDGERAFGRSIRTSQRHGWRPRRLPRTFGRYERAFGRYERAFGRYERAFGRFIRAFAPFDRSFGRYERSFERYEGAFGRSERSFGPFE